MGLGTQLRMRKTTDSNTALASWLSLLRVWARGLSGRRLLVGAAVLHVALALTLHWAGRAQVAPGFIDRDGIMDAFAHDSYEYQSGAVRLAEVLKREGLAAWAAEGQPLHVRVISLQFALLGPLTGNSPLSAEPFNLACYLGIVGLTLLLGREIGGVGAGRLAASVVAVWPTFLLHTLQLLKDPLFIALALALVLCVTTWLTRDYGPAAAGGAFVFAGASALLLVLIRLNFAVVVFALVLGGGALLAVRQFAERRWLGWNMAVPILILVAGAFVTLPVLFSRPAVVPVFKAYPSDGGGRAKATDEEAGRVTTVAEYLPSLVERYGPEPGRAVQLLAAADSASRSLGAVRSRFSGSYPDAGSGMDSRVVIEDFASMLRYLPRAFTVGMWAPFPNSWAGAGRRVGSVGKLLSGAETLVIYLFQLLALAAVVLSPRRLAAWLLAALTTFGVTALGLVVPNLGALFRFRYTFWILLIVLGAKGLGGLRRLTVRGRRTALACAALACLGAVGLTTVARPLEGKGAAVLAVPPEGRAGDLRFTLFNNTGTLLHSVYISPGTSAGWEENVAGQAGLADGKSLEIRFSPEEQTDVWDMRIEGVDGHFAEWKGLRLGKATRVRMFLDARGERVVVARVR